MNETGRDLGGASAPVAREGGDAQASKAKSGGFGDLGPRVASAVVLAVLALATLVVGGHMFVLFWLIAAFAINWEWQALIGGERRLARVVIGAVALSAAAGFTHGGDTIPGVVVLVLLAGVVAILAGPSRRLWAFAGLIYAGALVVSVCALRRLPGPRPARRCVVVRAGLGRGCFRLLWRPHDWRTQAMAARFRWKNLVWNDNGRTERRVAGSRRRPFRRGRTDPEPAHFSGEPRRRRARASRRSLRIDGEATLRR